ncbi:MAG TPA: amidase family protein [Dongiaceae bacterium]|nr:amidase family protein [Dongiaceae bacterium]
MTNAEAATETAIAGSTATALAAALASGRISTAEAVEAHIARIEAVNPRLNAVVVRRYAEARAEAREADRRRAAGEPLGPLHGVPVTVKECLDLAGTPSTFGLAARAAQNATADDTYVARLRAAGAIVLGKTNVAQLLMSIESYNPHYGRTNNPWNVDRSPGGSSGGEAAIIAAGGSALGVGTDIGGSSRVPAAFCGIVGFKPTQGRTPDAGRGSIPIGQRAIVSQIGVLARSVDDVALALGVVAGAPPETLDPPVALGDHRAVEVGRLRVAVYEDDGLFPAAPAVKRAVREAAQSLAAAGAAVTPWTPPGLPVPASLFFGVMSADRGRGLRALLRGEKVDPNIAPLVMMAKHSRRGIGVFRALLGALGQRRTAEAIAEFGYGDTHRYWQLAEAQLGYRRRFADALDRDAGGPFDVVLCPPCALPAFTHGAARELGLAGTYSLLPNVLGFPAGVVPVSRVRADEEDGQSAASRDAVDRVAATVRRGSAGLPVGVQIIARPWREDVALAAMRAIQSAASERAGYPVTPVTERATGST